MTITIILIVLMLAIFRAMYQVHKQPNNEKRWVVLVVELLVWIFLMYGWVEGYDIQQGVYLSSMSLISVGCKARFHPLSLLEHREGQIVEVIAPVPAGSTADWVVRFEDGFMPYVFDEELYYVEKIGDEYIAAEDELWAMPGSPYTTERVVEDLLGEEWESTAPSRRRKI